MARIIPYAYLRTDGRVLLSWTDKCGKRNIQMIKKTNISYVRIVTSPVYEYIIKVVLLQGDPIIIHNSTYGEAHDFTVHLLNIIGM